jgi:hypothetical protein
MDRAVIEGQIAAESGSRLETLRLSEVPIRPADKTSAIATIEASMPPLTKAAMTLRARALCFRTASEYVFT